MNNKVIINNLPSSNRKEFGYKGVNSSANHNINQEQILGDILDLFNKANELERVANENIEFIKAENTQLEVINKALLDKFNILKAKFEALEQNSSDMTVIIAPYECATYNDSYGAVIDKNSSDITVRPSSKTSKAVIFDTLTDTVFLPESLAVEVRPRNLAGIVTETDNDIFAPFYKDNNLYWTRKVVTDNTVDYVETDYVITLPEDIQTTPDMNEIFINPFMSTVTNIEVRYGDSSRWESVDGIEYHPAINGDDTLDSYINSSRPLKVSFKDKKANQLKISIKCNIFKEGETNLRTFMYGIKEVGVYYNRYNTYEKSSFEFTLTIPELDNYIVTGITPFFNNGDATGYYSRDFLTEIYYKDSAGYYHRVTDPFPFCPKTNELKVRCQFGERYTEMNMNKIELSYKKI